ncbi:MAG TPA: DNA ligase D [Geminicoccaceae bacterium]|nr:DNA ligase D [Geminicoccus sp.]HMU52105.1 DNA ligase D [Geminicoccaceae bacterium]
MALGTYREKRDFSATPEPSGRKKARAKGDSFVVQKHDARRLHYDFRLEMDGVLRSWAVTRGPSLVPGEKRLAVHVEDHPLEYGGFEGTIPKGEYGGGTVIVWDRGRWKPIGDAERGYAKGHLDFELFGEKLRGRWHLVRMAGKPREKRENWLLIKGDDDEARPEGAPDILEERPDSVKTGRSIDDVQDEPPGWSSKTGRIDPEPARSEVPDPASVKGARKGSLPAFVAPEFATLVGKPPARKGWIHEIKFDGYRLQARIDAGRVKLLTRTGLDWTARFGKEVPAALSRLPVGRALIDGELVVETDGGASDFSALQADLSAGRTDRFAFYAFDVLHLDGYDLRPSPLRARKELLKRLIAEGDPTLRYSEHFDEDGALILRHACRLSLEGVVSKRGDAPYRSGRSKDWLKSKCSQRQEFVVAGYVPSTTSRKAVGSLVLGYYRDGLLQHAGRVGTGFTHAVAEDLFRRLERLRMRSSPFAERLTAEAARQVRYVRPELVAEVEFRNWTADSNLRHASFRGLREDKPAEEVVSEAPATPARSAPHSSVVRLTHPDRLYWPDVGVTKEGLADYYSEVWRRMAPFVVARPLALVRCPGGVGGECFFQKHVWKGAGRSLQLARDPKDPSAEPMLVVNDLDGMLDLVQAGALEIHPWGSTLAALEQPDMIVLDLDPGEGVAWDDVVAAAREIRERLAGTGMASFVKTSGGKGLHVTAPLKPHAEWDAVKAFTKALAERMAADSPDRYVAVITKSKRRGRILVDYLRNGRGATAVAAYSTRARPGAPVSMPLAWDELGAGIGPAYFTVANTPTRLANLATDPWADFRRSAVPLPASSARSRRRAA